MPNYLLYTPEVETPAHDEQETIGQIIGLMADGHAKTEQKYGRSIRISHAKAHAILRGKLIVQNNLPFELAQGLFAKPASYDVLVRMASAPGELLDDSKVNATRGMAVKVLGVEGPKLSDHTVATQDFVFAPGKVFIAPNAAVFHQAFKPNAEIAPKLSDTTKGIVSTVSRATNSILHMFGIDSAKLDFFGHPIVNPLGEAQYSQTPFRYGEYVCKMGIIPDTPGLRALLEDRNYQQKTRDAMRDACNAYMKEHGAEYSFQVQLNTGLDEMPVEDATVDWPEALSMYQEVARLVIPPQTAFDAARDSYIEPLSFSPEHALAAHQPLGSINRARRAAYTALSSIRRKESGTTAPAEPSSTSGLSA
jgi:hypothetical protein